MPALTVRRIAAASGARVIAAAIQAIAPRNSPGRLGLAPWNTREAFQTMHQATKPRELNDSENISPNKLPAKVQSAMDAAPSRQAVPHHFNAGIFSCLPKNSSMPPSIAATIVA